MSLRYYSIVICVLVVFISCNSESKLEEEIASISMNVSVERFDQLFANTTTEGLSELKNRYPFFFPKQYNDSIWEQKLTDTLQIELNREVANKFPKFNKETQQIESLFKHLKHYFPEFKKPRVITKTSFVDYRDKIVIADSLLIIALDTYLGDEHYFYEGIQQYITKNLKPSQIMPDIVDEYGQQLVSQPTSSTLLSQMIYFGKILYLKDLLIPESTDYDKIGYTETELLWVHENEIEMWRYFIEKELLFSTNPKLLAQFINPAPFSKFYLEIDNESPGRIGRYLGWQIVRSYAEKNEVPLRIMLSKDADEIFNASNYKPKK
ncbi:MAG: gliding motility lipoprotein GldB [Campylobacteraceae bacterium]|nr:gliding motility lipoprotein GldB [Campylobacteraceae bacterium]